MHFFLLLQDEKHSIQLLRPTKLENDTWYLKSLGQDPKVVRKGESLVASTLLVSTSLTKNSAAPTPFPHLVVEYLFLLGTHAYTCVRNKLVFLV